MRARFLAALSVIGLMLVSFVATAYAASSATPDDGSLLDLARPVFDSIMAGQYLAATALALVFAVAMFKRYAPGKLGKFAHSDAGGATTTLAMSFFGAIATATAATGSGWSGLSMSVLWTSTTIAIAAAGGYTLIKKLVVAPLTSSSWYQNKAPAWFKAAMQMVLWVFDKRAPAESALEDAKAAGDAAVEANPPGGAEAIIGKPEVF